MSCDNWLCNRYVTDEVSANRNMELFATWMMLLILRQWISLKINLIDTGLIKNYRYSIIMWAINKYRKLQVKIYICNYIKKTAQFI